jgi:hypothetical protein
MSNFIMYRIVCKTEDGKVENSGEYCFTEAQAIAWIAKCNNGNADTHFWYESEDEEQGKALSVDHN